MKRIFILILAIMIIIILCPKRALAASTDTVFPAANENYGGFIISPIAEPIPPNAIHIQTAEQLAAIGDKAGYYVLDNDINLQNEWIPINNFTGTLDGRGFSINNLYIKQNKNIYAAGLIGYSSLVTLKNLAVNIGEQGIVALPEDGVGVAGGLVASGGFITISNCYVKGTVSAVNSGGFIGEAYRTVTITDSYTTGEINAQCFAGGFIGYAMYYGNIIIEHSFSKSDVSSTTLPTDAGAGAAAGGFIGKVYTSVDYYTSITTSYWQGKVSSLAFSGGFIGICFIGDLAEGVNYLSVTECYTSGLVEANAINENSNAFAGGFVGLSLCSFNFQDSYSTCNVLAVARIGLWPTAYSGGFVAYSDLNDNQPYVQKYSNCYVSGSVSALSNYSAYSGGFLGYGGITFINNSFATGNVNAESNSLDIYATSASGGFAGRLLTTLWSSYDYTTTISNSYTTGKITAKSAILSNSLTGGFIGSAYGTSGARIIFEPECKYSFGGKAVGGEFDGSIEGLENVIMNGPVSIDEILNTTSANASEFRVYAYDIDTGKHLSDATVSLSGGSKSKASMTGTGGVAVFNETDISLEAQTITLDKAEYFSYEKTNITPSLGKILKIGLKKKSDKPSAVSIVLKEKEKADLDITQNVAYFNESIAATFSLHIEAAYSKGSIAKYELYQRGKKVKETDSSGVFDNLLSTDFEAGKKPDFEEGEKPDIFLKIIASDNSTSGYIRLNIVIQQDPFNAGKKLELKIGSSGAGFTVPSSVPYIGGSEIKADFGLIPIDFVFEKNKIKICFGRNNDDIPQNDPLFNEKFNTKFDAIKKMFKSDTSFMLGNLKGSENRNPFIKSFMKDIKPRIDFFGYIEGTWNNGEFKLIEGMGALTLGLGGTTEYQVFPAIVASVGFDLSSQLTGTISLDISNGELTPSVETTIKIQLSARAGVGVAYVASVGVEGEAEAKYVRDWTEKYNRISLDGSFGAYAKLFIFEYTWPFVSGTLFSRDWYDNGLMESGLYAAQESFTAKMMDTANYTLSERDYLDSQSVWLGEKNNLRLSALSSTENDIHVLQQSVYDDTKPIIAAAGETRLMVFLSDDGSREPENPNSLNRTKLVYSLYNPETNSWGEPLAVWDDGTADFHPDIYSDGTDIYITWQNCNEIFTSGASLEEVIASTEICVAKFDVASNTITGKSRITSNNTLDSQPQIAIINNVPIVTWINNADNNIWGTNSNNAIMYSICENGSWSTPKVLKNNLTSVVATSFDGLNDTPVIAYICDGDNDLATIDDRSLFALDLEGNLITVTDKTFVSKPEFAYIDGIKALTWYENNNIFYTESSDFSYRGSFFETEKESFSDDYTLVTDSQGNRIAFYFTSSEGKGVINAYIYDKDSKQWSESVEIMKSGTNIRYVDGFFENNNMRLIFNRETSENSEISGHSSINDLCEYEYTPINDISLTNIVFDYSQVVSGERLPVTIEIENNGQTKISKINIDVMNGESLIDTLIVSSDVLPGENAALDVEIQMPESINEKTELNFTVTPFEVPDADLTDNSLPVIVGYPDLSLAIESFGNNNTIIVSVELENKGEYPTNSTLFVREEGLDGEILYSLDIAEIEPKSQKITIISLDTSKLSFADGTRKALYFEVVSDKDEILLWDNSDFIIMELPAYNVIVASNSGGTISGDGVYSTGDEVTLTASPLQGYIFNGWYENSVMISKEEAFTFTVFSDRNIEAVFSAQLSYIPLTDVELNTDENLIDLTALKASGKLPVQVMFTYGTTPAVAEITDWKGDFDGTAAGPQTLTAIWTTPLDFPDITVTPTVYLTVNVNAAQTVSIARHVVISRNGTELGEWDDIPFYTEGAPSVYTYEAKLINENGAEIDGDLVWSYSDTTSSAAFEINGNALKVTPPAVTTAGSITITATETFSGKSKSILVRVIPILVDWTDVDAVINSTAYRYGDNSNKAELPESGFALANGTYEGTFSYAEPEETLNTVGEKSLTVYFTIDSDNETYPGVKLSRTYIVNVKKRSITIKMDDKTKSYASANPELTYHIVSGDLAEGDTLTDIGILPVCGAGTTSPAGIKVDITAVWESENYEVTVEKGILAITPAHYTFVVGTSQNVKAGSGLSALKRPETGVGMAAESVAGEFGWYIDAALSMRASDTDVSTLNLGAERQLYWSFKAIDSNYVSEPKTGAVTLNILDGDPQSITFVTTSDVIGGIKKAYGDDKFTIKAANQSEGGGAVTYSSSAPAVAAVDANGEVAILGAGQTIITAAAAAVPGTWARTSVSYTLTVERRIIEPGWLVEIGDVVYTGGELKPAVEVREPKLGLLVEGKDYTVSYANNISASDHDSEINPPLAVITAIETGNYKGEASGRFSIKPKPIDNEDITIDPIVDRIYNGSAQEPVVKVRHSDRLLTPDADYSVDFQNVVDASDRAKVNIVGKGNYTGERSVYFTIVPAPIKGVVVIKGNSYQNGAEVIADISGVTPSKGLSYAWYVGEESNPAGDKDRYIITDVTTGEMLRVTVTASGNFQGSLTSNPVEIGKIPLTGSVSINSSEGVAQGDTLTAEVTLVTTEPSFSFQWLRNGELIPGATGRTHTITWEDLGTVLALTLTGSGDYTGVLLAKGIAVPATPPAAPIVTATAGDAQITAHWQAPKANGSPILAYRIRIGSEEWIELAPNVTTYTFTGVKNGFSYTVEVRGVNAIGAGELGTVTVTPIDSSGNGDDGDDDSNNSGGTGSGIPSTGVPVIPPVQNSNTTVNTSGTITTVSASVKSKVNAAGIATAKVEADMINALIESAKTAESENKTVLIEIRVEHDTSAKAVEVVISVDAFKMITSKTASEVKFASGMSSITFDSKAVKTIGNGVAAGDVIVRIESVDTDSLSQNIREVIGEHPVYDFSVTTGGSQISDLKGGKASLSVSYTLKPDEDPNAIIVYYIAAKGDLALVRGAYNIAAKTVDFTTDHFSKYAVGYNKVIFNDVGFSAWYYNAVTFIAARGITAGTGTADNLIFSPDAVIDRAQFLVMLMRAYGIAPDENLNNNFSDAGSGKYYTPYLATAKHLGIAYGVGENRFNPDQAINRQDMFTLLYRTLSALSEVPQKTSESTSLLHFSDGSDVADYARDSVEALISAGIVTGYKDKIYPSERANRAEMAQLLYILLTK